MGFIDEGDPDFSNWVVGYEPSYMSEKDVIFFELVVKRFELCTYNEIMCEIDIRLYT